MKKYNITVNGKTYAVEVEEVGGVNTPAPVTPDSQQRAVMPEVSSSKPFSSGNNKGTGDKTVTAPMPGKVLDVRVKASDTIEAGQTIVVLEAMKMENEIMAGGTGIVESVNAVVGSAVNAGDILVTLR